MGGIILGIGSLERGFSRGIRLPKGRGGRKKGALLSFLGDNSKKHGRGSTQGEGAGGRESERLRSRRIGTADSIIKSRDRGNEGGMSPIERALEGLREEGA